MCLPYVPAATRKILIICSKQRDISLGHHLKLQLNFCYITRMSYIQMTNLEITVMNQVHRKLTQIYQQCILLYILVERKKII